MKRHLPLLLTVASVILSILTGVVMNIATAQLPPWLATYQSDAWSALIVLVVLSVGAAVWTLRASQADTPDLPAPDRAARERVTMLALVRTTWIDGLLKHSLYATFAFRPGLVARPDAVRFPLNAQVQELGGTVHDLLAGTAVIDVYDRFGGKLLILGAPGGGKTTLLLELADELLERAVQDATQPIPVVFNLSSWAVRRLPLEQWLIEELVASYQVSRKTARVWVEQDQLEPLLDGLDEVAQEQRAACIAAINAFLATRGLLPIVVCSRLEEYTELTQGDARLHLQGAILIQSLTRTQVGAFLTQTGASLAGLRADLAADTELWKFAVNPLLLAILVLAYAGQAADTVTTGATLEERRRRLFDTYLERVYERRGEDQRFPRERALRWLAWLAGPMRNADQSVLYLERMQPEWLPTRWMRWWWRAGSVPGVGLSAGLGIALLVGLVFGLGVGLLGGLVFGLAFGLAGGLGLGRGTTTPHLIFPTETLRWSWSRFGHELRNGMVVGLMVGLVTGLVIAPVFGLSVGLGIGLGIGLVGGFVPGGLALRRAPNEGIGRSVSNAVLSFLVGGLFLGLAFGLGGGLGGGLSGGLGGGLLAGLERGGLAVIQHYVLRLILARADLAPLNYVAFLDDAASRLLLRKVGGGYVFIHRMLLDYFGDREAELVGIREPVEERTG